MEESCQAHVLHLERGKCLSGSKPFLNSPNPSPLCCPLESCSDLHQAECRWAGKNHCKLLCLQGGRHKTFLKTFHAGWPGKRTPPQSVFKYYGTPLFTSSALKTFFSTRNTSSLNKMCISGMLFPNRHWFSSKFYKLIAGNLGTCSSSLLHTAEMKSEREVIWSYYENRSAKE